MQLSLPLDWPADSRACPSPPTLTLSEYLRLAMASPDILMDAWYPSGILDFLYSPQMEFSGPSWRKPSALWLSSVRESKQQDSSPLYRTSHTTWVLRDSAGVPYADESTRKHLALALLNSVNGAWLEAEFYGDSFSGAKPKFNS